MKDDFDLDDDDFGFSMETEKDIIDKKPKDPRFQELEKLIIPLLKNLMKNPEKEIIRWPNRVEVIQKQMDKILKITRS